MKDKNMWKVLSNPTKFTPKHDGEMTVDQSSTLFTNQYVMYDDYKKLLKAYQELEDKTVPMRDRHITTEECKEMDLDTAMCEMGNKIYMAAIMCERLEMAKKVFGNGHHFAQHVVEFAMHKLYDRWEDEKEKEKYKDRKWHF